jgi:hypothetical protein
MDNRPTGTVVGLFGESTTVEGAVAIRIIIEEDYQSIVEESHHSSSERDRDFILAAF